MPRSTRITRLSVADQVYQHLRAAILSGEIAPGERVVESRLAETLSTSRAPVREAVNRLVQEGLLETRTHFGPSVVEMSSTQLRQLYEVRLAIETLAVREICRRERSADLQPLHDLVERMRFASRKGDLVKVVEAELKFHRALCELAENPFILQVGEMLDGQIRLALALDNARYPELEEVAEEHVPLLAALHEGDADIASAMLEEHIMKSIRGLE